MFRLFLALTGAVTLLLSLMGRQSPGEVLGPSGVVQLAAVPTPQVNVVGLNAGPQLLALDDFSTSADQAWPAAARGGEYRLVGPSQDFTVNAGEGLMRTPAGEDRGATLPGIRARDVDVRVEVESDKPAEGGDQFVFLALRQVDSQTSYRARLRLDASGGVWLQFARMLRGSSELLGTETRVGEKGNARVWLRAEATGAAPTTLLLKAWPDSGAEPEAWQSTTTDGESRLAQPGAVGLATYVSARATNAPVTFRFADLRVAAPAAARPTLEPSPRIAPTPSPTIAPTLVPTPAPKTAAEVWADMQPELNATWGHDTAHSVALLEDYLKQFPDDQTARDKLYAALVANGRDLRDQGDVSDSVAVFQQAQDLLPARGEAAVELTSSVPSPTPTPRPPTATPVPRTAPAPPPPAVRQPAPAPVVRQPAPAPVVRQPAPAPVVRAPAATPTKIPFAVPRPQP